MITLSWGPKQKRSYFLTFAYICGFFKPDEIFRIIQDLWFSMEKQITLLRGLSAKLI